MKLLLDQGIPRTTVHHLRTTGTEAVHVGEMSLAAASDAAILDNTLQEERILVTLDAGFHARLALSGAVGLSVIRIRIEGCEHNMSPACSHAEALRGRPEARSHGLRDRARSRSQG